MLEQFGIFVSKLIVAVLLLVAYMYIEKLETSGCLCADHPNKDFIKKFSLFGAVFLLVTMFVNPSVMGSNGPLVMLYGVVELIFLVMIIFYFYYTIDYVRYLVNEKCKCSDSMARDFIMWGSVIEFVLILIVLLYSMIIPVVSTTATTFLDSVDKTRKGVSQVVKDPVKSVVNLKGDVKKTMNSLVSNTKEIAKKTGKTVLKTRR